MKKLIPILFLFLSYCKVYGDTKEVRIEHYNLKNGLALKGYDPVAYFSGTAKKGDKKYAHSVEGVTYYFSSAENLKKFKAKPAQYEPQYGGWCAYAFAIDKGKVKINPKSFKIIGGKLYLYYDSPLWGDTLKAWNKNADKPQLTSADKAWSKQKS